MSNVIMLPDPQRAPLLSERMHTPFVQELTNGNSMTVNGSPMSPAIWNLIVSHRDIKMWTKFGMKPNRAWTVTAFKNYFGLKGTRKTLLPRFEALKAEVDTLMGLNDEGDN